MNGYDQNSCSGDCISCTSDCAPDLSTPGATFTLTLEDDREVLCQVVAIFPVGERMYVALLPLDENHENHDGEVYLYRFLKEEGAQPTIDNICGDAEYEAAADAFDEMLDAAEYDEISDGDDFPSDFF